MRHKNIIGYLLAVSLVFTLFSFSGLAGQEKPKESKGKTTTVTGCLQKGDEENEFAISEGNKKYELTSRSVALKDHVGHTVTVTGTMKSEKGEEAEGWAGQITVTSLKMVSTSCK
jgi:hypothetical protein